MKPKLTPYCRIALILSLTCAFAVLESHAEDYTWSGPATSSPWTTAENWNPVGVPGTNPDDTATVNSAAIITLDSTNHALASFTIDSSGLVRVSNGSLELSDFLSISSEALFQNFYLTGSAAVNVTGVWRLGDNSISDVVSAPNDFSGGLNIDGGGQVIVALNSFDQDLLDNAFEPIPLLGTGDIVFGSGSSGSQGGAIIFDAMASANMTYENHFINQVVTGSPETDGVLIAAGQGANQAAVIRLTGDFSTNGSGLGPLVLSGFQEDGVFPNNLALTTFELTGDWTGYDLSESQIYFEQAAFYIATPDSVASGEGTYFLNSNDPDAADALLILGADFNGNTFVHDLHILNEGGDDNSSDAINKTFIGSLEINSGDNEFSGDISYETADPHRLALFSTDNSGGRLIFSGQISASSDQPVIINGDVSYTYHFGVDDAGIPDSFEEFLGATGVVEFTGGAKLFEGGLDVLSGSLVLNQSVEGDVFIRPAAVFGSEDGAQIDGDLSIDGILDTSTSTISVSGTLALALANMVVRGELTDGQYVLIEAGEISGSAPGLVSLPDVTPGTYVFSGENQNASLEIVDTENGQALVLILGLDEVTPPAAPTDLLVQAVAADSVDLVWTDESDNEDGFQVQISADGGDNWSDAAGVGAGIITITIDELAPGQTYHFRVRAFNSDGESAWSNVVSTTTLTLQQAWRTQYFTSAQLDDPALEATLWGDAADPDGDGLSNLLEYALGGLPLQSSASVAPTPGTHEDNGDTYLSLNFSRIADPTLTYEVWASNNLVNWGATPIWSSTGAANVAGPVTVIDTVTMSDQNRRFLRLTVRND